jgi:hypothetical protein
MHRRLTPEELSSPECADNMMQEEERARSVCFEKSVVGTHHIMEEVKIEWLDHADHEEPVEQFFQRVLGDHYDLNPPQAGNCAPP